MAAMVLAMPLDTARTRVLLENSTVQELKQKESVVDTIVRLIRNEGLLSLFKGGQTTLICVAVSNFVYFYTFHSLKKLVVGTKKQTALKDLLFACVAGLFHPLHNFTALSDPIPLQGQST